MPLTKIIMTCSLFSNTIFRDSEWSKSWIGNRCKKESCHITSDTTLFNSFPCIWLFSAHCDNWCWCLQERFFPPQVLKASICRLIHQITTHLGWVKSNKTWLMGSCWLPRNYSINRFSSRNSVICLFASSTHTSFNHFKLPFWACGALPSFPWSQPPDLNET